MLELFYLFLIQNIDNLSLNLLAFTNALNHNIVS